MSRIAIVTTHPIQYNAPWFSRLSLEPDLDIRVYYTWSQRQVDFFDEGFGREVKWDIPLLEGYSYEFVENTSSSPGNKTHSGIRCPELIPKIESWNPTAILVFGWNFHAHFSCMRHFKGRIPVLFRGDSTLLDEQSGVKNLIRRLVLRRVYRFIDAALYTGEANKAYFRKHGVREKQLFHAPHAIDNARFASPVQQDIPTGLLDQFSSMDKKNGTTILFVGKLESKKNPMLLIQAFGMLMEKPGPNSFQLVIVGNGPLEEGLKQEARKYKGIHFLPFQNQSLLPWIYNQADVLCLPSGGPGETWGLVVNEAMAAGLPCVISDSAGSAWDLGTYPGNRMFSSKDPVSLANALQDYAEPVDFDPHAFLEKWNYDTLTAALKAATNIHSS